MATIKIDSHRLIKLIAERSLKQAHQLIKDSIGKKSLGFDIFSPATRKDKSTPAPEKPGKQNLVNWAVELYGAKIAEHLGMELIADMQKEEKHEDSDEEFGIPDVPETKPKNQEKQMGKQVDFSNLGKVFEEIFEGIGGSVDKEEVKEIVEELIAPAIKEAIAKIQPELIIVDKVKDVEFKTDGPVNKKVFKKALKLCQIQGANVMLVGPAGSGKTHIAGQLAKATGRTFASLSVTAGISESHLTGWLLPIGETKAGHSRFIHLDAPFLKAYEEGNAIILLDEMDACDPNVLLTINQALANGGFTVAQRHEKAYVKRGENVTVIGACNTYGNGADHRYVGREQLDLSTLDRFHTISMDYDRDLEKALIGENHILIEWSANIRKAISRHELNRIFSTRKLLDYYKFIESEQFTLAECKEFYFEGWGKDELAKVV